MGVKVIWLIASSATGLGTSRVSSDTTGYLEERGQVPKAMELDPLSCLLCGFCTHLQCIAMDIQLLECTNPCPRASQKIRMVTSRN